MTNIKQSTSTSKRTKKSYKLKKPNLSFDDPRVKSVSYTHLTLPTKISV